jgi:hypothetical protein
MGIYGYFTDVRMSKCADVQMSKCADVQMSNPNNQNNILWVFMGVFQKPSSTNVISTVRRNLLRGIMAQSIARVKVFSLVPRSK